MKISFFTLMAVLSQFALALFAFIEHDYMEALAWFSCLLYNLTSDAD